MRKKLLIIALLITVVYGAWAQTDFGNLPETVNASDATITYYPKEEVTVYSFRAYFQLADGIIAGDPVNGEQGINTFVLNFDGLHSTGIVEAEDSSSSSEWFTVDGRKLVGKPTQKGIYINNGRSIVIK